MKTFYLCFIKYIGKNINGQNSYEFLFTEDPDTFWGENFEYMPCCLCNEFIPNEEQYNLVKVITTDIRLNLITESCCNSIQDCMDGIICLGYEDISDYDEYPQNGRLVLPYGITYEETEQKLAKKDILFN